MAGEALFRSEWQPTSVQDRAILRAGPSHPQHRDARQRVLWQEGRIAEVEQWLLRAGAVEHDRHSLRRVKLSALRDGLEREPAALSTAASEPKAAPVARIHAAIVNAYDAAKLARKKPPNLIEITAPVLVILGNLGLTASKRQIQELARQTQHAQRRRPPGKTVSSETSKKPQASRISSFRRDGDC